MFYPLATHVNIAIEWLSMSDPDQTFCITNQRAKKVVSDSPGLVDFATGLVKSVFNLPDGQVMFFEEFK